MQSKLKNILTGDGPLYAAVAGAFLFGLWRGPIVGLDTVGYVAGDIIRTPLYPIFLMPFTALLGDDWTRFTYPFQLGLVLFACWSVARSLSKHFFPGVLGRLFLLAILMTPVLGPNGIGNKYYSEGLAYSCFLFTIHFFVQAAHSRRARHIALMLAFLLLALLTRPQMFILCVVPGILAVYLLLTGPGRSEGAAWFSTLFSTTAESRRAFLLTAGGLVLTLLLSGFLTRAYNYVRHDRFVSVPFTGMNLSTAILYVSSPEDADVYAQGTEERAFLDEVLNTIDAGGHGLRANQPPNFLALSNHYIANYNQIAWLTAYATYKKRFTETPQNRFLISVDEFVHLDALLVDSARRLAPRHVPRLIKLYASNILRGLGGYYYAAFLITVFGVGLFLFLKTRETFLAVLVAITALNFVNYLLLGVMQMVMTRYTFYTDTLQLCLLALWIFRASFGVKPEAGDSAGIG